MSDRQTYVVRGTFKNDARRYLSAAPVPAFAGLLAFFPHALREVARASAAGAAQRSHADMRVDLRLQTGHLDAATRHLLAHASGTVLDADGVPHLAKVAWRCLAELERTARPTEAAPVGMAPEADFDAWHAHGQPMLLHWKDNNANRQTWLVSAQGADALRQLRHVTTSYGPLPSCPKNPATDAQCAVAKMRRSGVTRWSQVTAELSR